MGPKAKYRKTPIFTRNCKWSIVILFRLVKVNREHKFITEAEENFRKKREAAKEKEKLSQPAPGIASAAIV